MNKKKVASFSRGIVNNEIIKIFLEVDALIYCPKVKVYEEINSIVGWGKKKNTKKARLFAKKNEIDYFSLEDGFLHSMGQGVLGDNSCSLVVDKKGIYYDATCQSDLEVVLTRASSNQFSEDNLLRARNAIKRITQHNITKYNNGSLSIDLNSAVLIIDQTLGDMSLKYGLADKLTFQNMVDDAVRENPNSQIVIKTHPDVLVGKKKGCIDLDSIDASIKIISANVNPIALLKKVDKVYVATSQMGFEALMLGKEVICYGVPFYALWGLTEDRSDENLPVRTRRNINRSLEEVFFAAYISYSRYLHPDSKKRCDLETILDYFELQYKNKLKYHGLKLFCINFTRWKQNHIQSFLSAYSGSTHPVEFISSLSHAEKEGFNSHSQLITWSSKNQDEVAKIEKKWGGVSWYMEDGFIRSTGLGTDLTAPASLVLDKTGIYYDPNNSSDLETLLQTKKFEAEELARAGLLRRSLLDHELSKYNLGQAFDKSQLNSKPNQTLILIPGQVEDDASIKKGCVDVNTNAQLIRDVRANNPEAFLIYKPHPDVVSGNRKGKVDKAITAEFADLVLLDASITDCLNVVDEVHTMTSLVGFEGLLRKLKVVCYGIPFYSGWGLTKDFHKVARRTRKLTLNQLVHATLIEYPLYMNWETKTLTTPEIIIEQLSQQIAQQGGKQSNQVSSPIRLLRKINNFLKGVLVK